MSMDQGVYLRRGSEAFEVGYVWLATESYVLIRTFDDIVEATAFAVEEYHSAPYESFRIEGFPDPVAPEEIFDDAFDQMMVEQFDEGFLDPPTD